MALATYLPHNPVKYAWDQHEHNAPKREQREYFFKTPVSLQEYEFELACAARCEGLADDEITALLTLADSDPNETEVWRNEQTGRWQVKMDKCHWSRYPIMWLPEWAAWYRAQQH